MCMRMSIYTLLALINGIKIFKNSHISNSKNSNSKLQRKNAILPLIYASKFLDGLNQHQNKTFCFLHVNF